MTAEANLDPTLATRLMAGDRLAFQHVYQCHGAAMFHYALALTGNRAAAEDAVQDVFLRVLHANQRFSEIADLGGYLLKSVRNHCLTRLKKIAREKPLAAATAENGLLATRPEDGDSAGGGAPETAQRLNRALAALPAAQREVVVLKNFNNLGFREIAQLLDEPLQTIASRHRLALEKLKEMYARDTRGPSHE